MNKCKCNSTTELNCSYFTSAYTETDLQSTHRRPRVFEVIWTPATAALNQSLLLAPQTLKLKPECLSSFFALLLFNYDLQESASAVKSHATAWLKEQDPSVWKSLQSFGLFWCSDVLTETFQKVRAPPVKHKAFLNACFRGCHSEHATLQTTAPHTRNVSNEMCIETLTCRFSLLLLSNIRSAAHSEPVDRLQRWTWTL